MSNNTPPTLLNTGLRAFTVIVSKFGHPTNACPAMPVTFLLIVTFVNVAQPLNVTLPSVVTGSPLIVSGIVTEPSMPM